MDGLDSYYLLFMFDEKDLVVESCPASVKVG